MKTLKVNIFLSVMLFLAFLNCEKNITDPDTNYSNFTVRQLTSTAEQDIYPSWSFDSKKIVFNREGSICVLDVQSNTVETFNVEMSGNSTPAFSPDGKSVFYEKQGSLYESNLVTGNQKKIPIGHFPVFFPCSSNDPDIIYFTHQDKIIEYNLAQGSSVEFQGTYRHQLCPRVTCSNKLSFMSYSNALKKTALSAFKDNRQILSLELDDPFYDEFIQFISDKNIITSAQSEQGRKIVAINSVTGSTIQQFTTGEHFDKHIALSPDNKMIAFSRGAITQADSAAFVVFDKPPQPIGGFSVLGNNLIYPDSALIHGIEGRVYVNTRVFVNGVVDSTAIIKGLGYGCDEAAIQAVKSATWMPAYQGNTAVPVWVGIPIVFRLTNLYKLSSSIKIDSQNVRYSTNERQDNLYLIELH